MRQLCTILVIISAILTLGEVLVFEYSVSQHGSLVNHDETVGGFVRLPAGVLLVTVAIVAAISVALCVAGLVRRQRLRRFLGDCALSTSLLGAWCLAFLPSDPSGAAFAVRYSTMLICVGGYVLLIWSAPRI